MARTMTKRLHVSMDLSRVDDKWRHDTIAGVAQVAPTSALYAIPGIQASVTALEALGASFKTANDTVDRPERHQGLGAVRAGARPGPEWVEHAGAGDDPLKETANAETRPTME
jgi:hypothetical protein